MGSSNDGTAAAPGAQGGPSLSGVEADPPSRGFFGRIFDALSPQDGADEEGDEVAPAQAPQGGHLHGIANLRRARVDDVAIPKVDIVAVPLDIGKEALVEVFRAHGFSRLPVYKGTLDDPQGLVLLKDFALSHGFGASADFSLEALLRPVLFAPPSMPGGVLLQKMQKDRVHMALVIDEYGGVDGLLTIEDLIETVIGEIDDEHDEDEDALWKEERPGVFVAQAVAPLTEFEAAIGMALRFGEEDAEIETLGGLVFSRTGRVPVRGETVHHESGAEFEVLDADARRLKRLRVRLPGVHATPEADAAAARAAGTDALQAAGG